MLSLFALTIAVQSEVVDVRTEPKLQTAITVELLDAPIDKALKRIAKSANVSLDLTTGLRDLHVTVLAKGAPVGPVLDKIASTLECEWHLDGTTFRLAQSSTRAREISSYVELENQLLHKPAVTLIQGLAKLASLDFVTASAVVRGDQNDSNVKLTTAEKTLLAKSWKPALYDFAPVVRNWGTNDFKRLWDGAISWTTPRSTPPPKPNKEVKTQKAGPAEVIENPRSNQIDLMRFDEFGTHALQVIEEPAPLAFSKEKLSLVPFEAPPQELAATPFAQSATAWSGTVDDKPLSGGDEPIAVASFAPISAQPQWSELLQDLHARTGMTIVADSFVFLAKSKRLSGSTGAAALKNFVNAEHAFLRIQDGIASLRHPGFWRLRSLNLPDQVLAPFAGRKGRLTFDEYASLVSQLTPAQAATFATEQPPATTFESLLLQTSIPAIRFYSSLDSERRLAARSRRGLPYSTLSGTSLSLYETAALAGPFVGARWMGRGFMGDVSALRFLAVSVGDELDGPPALCFGMSMASGVIYRPSALINRFGQQVYGLPSGEN